MLDASRSNAPSCHTSLTTTSSWPFVSGTTSRDLVQELGRNRPQTVDELMDIVANYAAGEEAVGAFFSCEGRKGKQPADEDGILSRGPKKNKKKQKAQQFP